MIYDHYRNQILLFYNNPPQTIKTTNEKSIIWRLIIFIFKSENISYTTNVSHTINVSWINKFIKIVTRVCVCVILANLNIWIIDSKYSFFSVKVHIQDTIYWIWSLIRDSWFV